MAARGRSTCRPRCTARRWRLGNGLGLISAVDKRAPIVALQTWYRVGSRHERPGATGMAHLFEHLMFGQTESLPPGEFDRLVERTGGESNAATWVDWTYYRLSLPARDLELGIKLEAERMQHLVLETTPVESERDVVTNERRERVEDDVDGWLDEQLMAHAFTEHPYRWPTIGWMEDIRALALPDIRSFYRTWYAPNNATLVVVGDFDDEALRELIAKYYGHIEPAQLPDAAPVIEPEQAKERIVRAPKPIATDRLLVGYKAPGQDDPDWAALEIVSTLLAGCPSARLYRRLVIESEAASSVDAQLTPFRDPSLLRLAVTTARGHNADEIIATIDREIARARRESSADRRGREGQGALRDRLLERARRCRRQGRGARSLRDRARRLPPPQRDRRAADRGHRRRCRARRPHLSPADQAHDRDRRARTRRRDAEDTATKKRMTTATRRASAEWPVRLSSSRPRPTPRSSGSTSRSAAAHPPIRSASKVCTVTPGSSRAAVPAVATARSSTRRSTRSAR